MTNSKPTARAPATAMLRDPQDALFLSLQESGLSREAKQFAEFNAVDLAHVTMLIEQGVVPFTEGRALLQALMTLREEGPNVLAMDLNAGSLLHQIEEWLGQQVGTDVAGRLHTGRSRIDQGATVRRMFKRRYLLEVMQELRTVQDALCSLAAEHQTTIMPGYTHMQHAQPWVFGHYLLSIAERLNEDFTRLTQSYARLNRSPLGTVGLVGTFWPLDRERTQSLLGFSGLVENARLGRDATYAADALSALSFVMSTLNDLATDLHIWSTREFGLVETADAFSGTSSIFPQKKNPEALEMIRYAAGGAVTWLGSALAIFRGEGSGDQAMRELPLFDGAAETTRDMLALTSAVLTTVTVRPQRMLELLASSWCTASNLADQLVAEEGLSFRHAHHVVARFVRDAVDAGLVPAEVTSELLDQSAISVLGRSLTVETQVIRDALDPVIFMRTRKTRGSIALTEVEALLSRARAHIVEQTRWLEEQRAAIGKAREALNGAVQAILAQPASQQQ